MHRAASTHGARCVVDNDVPAGLVGGSVNDPTPVAPPSFRPFFQRLHAPADVVSEPRGLGGRLQRRCAARACQKREAQDALLRVRQPDRQPQRCRGAAFAVVLSRRPVHHGPSKGGGPARPGRQRRCRRRPNRGGRGHPRARPGGLLVGGERSGFRASLGDLTVHCAKTGPHRHSTPQPIRRLHHHCCFHCLPCLTPLPSYPPAHPRRCSASL